jgi:hypothetical protein
MKLKTSIILCAAAMATTAPAFANPAWDLYAGASIGVGAETLFYDDENKTNAAQSFGAMFGVDLPAFRIDAEYNYLNETDSHAHLALLNAYFKMPSTVVKPYLGIGVGLMFSGENEKYHADFDTTAAYQAMLGVTLDVAALPFKFDVEARALYLPDVYNVADIEPDILHYEARIKIRYMF